MIEVEAKLKVKNPGEMREKLRKIGKYKGKEKKTDYYFTTESLNKFPKHRLRIREKKGKYIVNFKERLGYRKGVHAKNEIELVSKDVGNLKDFMRVIETFGFKQWLVKEKETELYEIKKDFHVELNKVQELGWFIEIEYLVDRKNVRMARKKVNEVMKKLGYSEKDAIKESYTKMLWKKR